MDDASNIGCRLITSFRETFNEQVQKVLARRIHAKVRDARSDPDRAARRWPFELLQNAHDAGPRDGHDGISVTFNLDPINGVLRFQHDAAPFAMADIAALLTGGSSKDFDSRETTGRFGTGFLVTHALSERVHVSGILELDGDYRDFKVTLHRPNDETLILRNLKDSESALAETHRLPNLHEVPTAIVEYAVDDVKTAEAGLSAVADALPHLFGSCRRLRQITIRVADRERCWRVTSATPEKEAGGLWLDEIAVSLVDESPSGINWRVIRASSSQEASGRLIFALRQGESGWVACKPGRVPSVFRQLPLLGGPALSMWLIIDGEFDVDEERTSVHVLGEQGRPLCEALGALGGLALLVNREGWKHGYRVAQVAMPEGLGEKYAQVWCKALSAAATELSQLPLVSTVREGMLPGVQNEAHDRWADFISRESTGPSHAELWELAASCTDADPPMKEESEGWSEIAEGWEALGVSIPWMNLKEIGRRAASNADAIAKLAVVGPSLDWLARYLDAVGKVWRASGTTKDHVAGLLPDQHGDLHDAGELRRDDGVSRRVKEICESVCLDIKATLLDNALLESLRGQQLENGIYAIHECTGDKLSEDDVIRDLVDHLDQKLPADRPVMEKERVEAQATLSLLLHLWETKGIQAKEVAWKVPILAADGAAHRAGVKRMLVPPVAAWPEVARPFAAAYPESRILAKDYSAPEYGALLDAFRAWGIAHDGLLGKGQRDEIADRGLRAIAVCPDEVEGAKLRSAELSQIALLEPELINFCKQKRERARALLGLVVCYVAPKDDAWRKVAKLQVRTPEGEKEVEITPCLWLADLRSKPWIPVEDDEDVTHHVPNPVLLRELMDTSWLESNSHGVDLLVGHFDMDALDVRLLAATQDEQTRQRLRDELAKVVEVAGDNPAVIADLAAKAAQRKRDIERMRRLGLAVQARVSVALEELDLDVRVVDRGYDFLVTDVTVRDEDPEDLAAYFEVGAYKIEVKTTTTDEARLTPLQAETAEADPTAFVLCVVDLRSFDEDVHEVDWMTTDVSPYCRFVSGKHLPLNETLTFVRRAEGSDVPVRNATALRYAVQASLWSAGLALKAWVDQAFS